MIQNILWSLFHFHCLHAVSGKFIISLSDVIMCELSYNVANKIHSKMKIFVDFFCFRYSYVMTLKPYKCVGFTRVGINCLYENSKEKYTNLAHSSILNSNSVYM